MEQLQHGAHWTEYDNALGSLSKAKWLLWCLVVGCIVLQLGAFVLVDFAGVLGQARSSEPAEHLGGVDADWPAATPPTTAPASQAHARQTPSSGSAVWKEVIMWLLPATKSVATISSILLTIVVLLGVNMGIAARRNGMSAMTSAFLRSLLLAAILVPWQQVLGSRYTTGALCNLAELQRWRTESQMASDKVLYYARFIVYPLLAVALAVMTHLKFSLAIRQMLGVPQSKQPADTTTDRPTSSHGAA